MENVQNSHSYEMATDEPSVVDLIERRRELASELKERTPLFDALLDADIDQGKVAVYDELFDRYHDSDDDESQFEFMARCGRKVLSGELYGYVQGLARLSREQTAVRRSLDRLAGKPLNAYVRQQAQQLLDTVNPMKLRDKAYGYSADDIDAYMTTIFTLKDILTYNDGSYEQAEEMYDMVEHCRTSLEALDLLSVDEPEDVSDMPIVKHDKSELERAYDLNRRYRAYHAELNPDAAMRRRQLPIHEWQVHMSDETRQSWVEHLQAIDVQKEIDRLDIKGLDLLPIELSPAEIRGLLGTIPAIAFDGVTGIYFQDRSPQEGDDAANKESTPWTVLATHRHDLSKNSAEIIIWAESVRSHFAKTYDDAVAQYGAQDGGDIARTPATTSTIRFIKDQLFHEFGHAFHNKLPVGFLHDWDIAVSASQTDLPVSHYAEMAESIEEGTGDTEGFAESFRLCLLHPAELRYRASDRAAAMQALIDSCRP